MDSRISTHQNGHKSASPAMGEAFISTEQLPTGAFIATDADGNPSVMDQVHTRNQTIFPNDPPKLSLQTLLYKASRFYFGGVPLLRWPLVVLAIMALLWLTGLFVGGWIVSLVCLALFFTIIALLRYWKQRDFIRFEAETPPVAFPQTVTPKVLSPDEKIPVHVTGQFDVDGHTERFTWVSGFYRTFATREHALLCLVREQSFLAVARNDAEHIGMWYIFFQPDDIVQARWGKIKFGSDPRPCIALEKRIEVKAQRRFKRDKITHETIYIAFREVEDGQKIWADLAVDTPSLSGSG